MSIAAPVAMGFRRWGGVMVAVLALTAPRTLVRADTYQFFYSADARVKQVGPQGTTPYPFDDQYEVSAGVVTKYIDMGGELVAKRIGTTTF
jgi:hypothetical protein